MPCLFAVVEICHRSHSPLCFLFQIPTTTKIQVKIAQLILSPLLNFKHCTNSYQRNTQTDALSSFQTAHCSAHTTIQATSRHLTRHILRPQGVVHRADIDRPANPLYGVGRVRPTP